MTRWPRTRSAKSAAPPISNGLRPWRSAHRPASGRTTRVVALNAPTARPTAAGPPPERPGTTKNGVTPINAPPAVKSTRSTRSSATNAGVNSVSDRHRRALQVTCGSPADGGTASRVRTAENQRGPCRSRGADGEAGARPCATAPGEERTEGPVSRPGPPWCDKGGGVPGELAGPVTQHVPSSAPGLHTNCTEFAHAAATATARAGSHACCGVWSGSLSRRLPGLGHVDGRGRPTPPAARPPS